MTDQAPLSPDFKIGAIKDSNGVDPLAAMRKAEAKMKIRRAVASVYGPIREQIKQFGSVSPYQASPVSYELVQKEWNKFLEGLSPRQRERYRPETRKDKLEALMGKVKYDRPEEDQPILLGTAAFKALQRVRAAD